MYLDSRILSGCFILGVDPQKEVSYMDGTIKIDAGYTGYTFLGWAKGMMEQENRLTGEKQLRPYFNIYVTSPVSSWVSDTYEACGLKAEKKKCVSEEVWKDLQFGAKVRLFFDDKQRVIMAALDG